MGEILARVRAYLKEASTAKFLYALAILMMAMFIIVRIDALAIVSAMLFIFGVISESAQSAKEKGLWHELKEIGIAIALALMLWFGASFVLNTSSPFNAVVSCSMLNTLHRGDVIILHGGQVNAPEITVDPAELAAALERGEEHFMCGLCRTDAGLVPCTIDALTGEAKNGTLIRYNCGICTQTEGNIVRNTVCTVGVHIGGKYIDASKREGDIIVYRPWQGDLFARTGDIIHRALAKVRAGNETYILTKGDNNPVFDTQFVDPQTGLTNSIVTERQVIGKSLLSLPFFGYVKLVAAGQLASPKECNVVLGYVENQVNQ